MPQIVSEALIASMASDQAPRVVTNGSLIDTVNRGIIWLTASPAFDRSNQLTAGAGWYATNATIATDTSNQYEGNSQKVTNTGGGNMSAIQLVQATLPAGAGNYRAVAWCKAPTITEQVTLSIDWYNSGGTFISTSTGSPFYPGTGWTPIYCDAASPAGAANFGLRLAYTNSPSPPAPGPTPPIAAGEIHYFVNVSLGRKESITGLRLTAGTDLNRLLIILNETSYDFMFDVPANSLVADGGQGLVGTNQGAGSYTGGGHAAEPETALFPADIPAHSSRSFTWNGVYWYGSY